MNPTPRTPASRSTRGRKTQSAAAPRRKPTAFESFAETTSAVILIVQDRRILYANPATTRSTGYSGEELLEMELWQLGHPNYQQVLKQPEKAQAWTKHLPSRFEIKIVTKSGEARWLDVTLGNIDYKGKSAIAVTAFDITDRDQAERELRQAHAELETRVQARTAELAATNERLQSVLDTIAEAYMVFDADWRFVAVNPAAETYIFGRPATELIGKSIWDEYPQTVGGEVYVQYQLAVETGQPVHFETQSRITPGHWFEVHAYPRRNSMEVYCRDITERKRAEEEIASLARFPGENPNPVLRLDQTGSMSYANAAGQALLRVWVGTTGDSALAHWRNLAAEAVTKRAYQTVDFECDGRAYSFFVVPILEAGYVNFYGRDITARKQAEEALRESEERYRLLFDNSLDGILLTTPDGGIQAANAAACRMFGRTEQEICQIGRNGIVDVVDPRVATAIEERARTGKSHTEMFLRRGDGTRFLGEVSSTMFKGKDGRLRTSILVRDITERKRAEEALRESEQKYALLFDKAAMPAALTKLPENAFADINAAFEKLFGYTRQEAVGKTSLELGITKPEEHAVTVAEIEQRGVQRDAHKHVFTKSGEERIVSLNVSALDMGGQRYALATVQDITERKRAEEALRESEEKYRRLIENIDDLVCEVDAQARYQFVNSRYEQILGYAPQELLGHYVRELIHPDDLKLSTPGFKTLMDGGAVSRNEWRFKHKNGEWRWFDCIAQVYEKSPGEQRVVVISRDVTERKEKEVELAKLNRALRALSDSNQAMMRAEDEAEYLAEICKIVVRDCGHPMVWIGFAEQDEGKAVRPVAHAGFEEGYLATLKITWADTERGRGPTGTAIRTGKQSGCSNMLTDPNFAPWQAEAIKRGYAASIALPLIANDRAFGAITIYAKTPEAFSEEESKLLAELAGDLAHGIAMLRLRAAHAQAEEALRLSEERYRSLFTGMTEGFALHEIIGDERGVPYDYRFLEINPAFERLTGLKREEVIGRTHNEVLPDDSPRWAERYGEVVLTGQPAHFENYSAALDRYYDVFAYCPAPHQFAVLVMDITQRKRAEEKMAWLASFPELSPNPVVEVDLDGHLHYLNPAAQRLLPRLASNGIRHPWLAGLEAIGKHFRSQPTRAVMREVTFGEKIYQQSFYYVAATQCVRVYGWDITQRKRAEDALRQVRNELEVRVQERTHELAQTNEELRMEIAERERVENQLRLQMTAVQAAANGIVITDRQGRIQWCNPAFTHMTGYSAEEVAGQTMRILHSGKQAAEFYEQLWATILAGEVWRGEITNRHKDGHLYVEEQTIAPVLNEQRALTHFVAVKQDITERKQAEDRLARYNQELLALSKAERDQRQLAETLTAANSALTQSLNLETVLETLLDYVARLVPYDSANVMLLESEARLAVRVARGYERWSSTELVRTITFDAQATPVLNTLLTTRRSCLVPDTGLEPSWQTPPGVEHVRSWLGVPLMASGNVIGLYSLDKTEPGFFTTEHVRLAEMLVGQASVAIQNAWLFEQVRAGRERLQSLSRRLVEAHEAERHYVARELHDEAGQALTSLLFKLGQLEQQTTDLRQADQVAELKQMTNGVLESLHRLAMDLRPASLDHLGLVPALLQYVKAIGDRYNIIAQFKAVGFEGERLAADVETALYRIVQEALTNIVRHAHAARADVLLERRGDRVIVVIEDDGLGFEVDVARFAQHGHLGLAGMQERAEMLGGSLVIESTIGTGTTIVVEVPHDHSHFDR